MVHGPLVSTFITLTVNEPANIGRQYSHKSISYIHNEAKTIHLTPFHTHKHSLSFSLSHTHTHTHTHALSLSHTHTHTLTHFPFSSHTTKNNHFSVADIFSHFCVVPKETMIRKGFLLLLLSLLLLVLLFLLLMVLG